MKSRRGGGGGGWFRQEWLGLTVQEPGLVARPLGPFNYTSINLLPRNNQDKIVFRTCLELASVTCIFIQAAQNVMCDHVEQVDFTTGEVNFHAHLPDDHLTHGPSHLTT